eukprot:749490-Hanusia_phi.AAC.4
MAEGEEEGEGWGGRGGGGHERGKEFSYTGDLGYMTRRAAALAEEKTALIAQLRGRSGDSIRNVENAAIGMGAGVGSGWYTGFGATSEVEGNGKSVEIRGLGSREVEPSGFPFNRMGNERMTNSLMHEAHEVEIDSLRRKLAASESHTAVLLSEMGTIRKRMVELEMKAKQTDEIVSRNLLLQEKLELLNEEYKQSQENLRQAELLSFERESEARKRILSLSENVKTKDNEVQFLQDQMRQMENAIINLTANFAHLEKHSFHIFELTNSLHLASKSSMSKLEGFQSKQKSLLEFNQKMSMERNQILKNLHSLEQDNATLSQNLAVLKMQNKKSSQELEFQRKILQDLDVIKTEIETCYRETFWNAQGQGNANRSISGEESFLNEEAMKDPVNSSLSSTALGESLTNDSFDSKLSFNPFTTEGTSTSRGSHGNPLQIVTSLKQIVKQFLKVSQIRESHYKKNFYVLQETTLRADELAMSLRNTQSVNDQLFHTLSYIKPVTKKLHDEIHSIVSEYGESLRPVLSLDELIRKRENDFVSLQNMLAAIDDDVQRKFFSLDAILGFLDEAKDIYLSTILRNQFLELQSEHLHASLDLESNFAVRCSDELSDLQRENHFLMEQQGKLNEEVEQLKVSLREKNCAHEELISYNNILHNDKVNMLESLAVMVGAVDNVTRFDDVKGELERMIHERNQLQLNMKYLQQQNERLAHEADELGQEIEKYKLKSFRLDKVVSEKLVLQQELEDYKDEIEGMKCRIDQHSKILQEKYQLKHELSELQIENERLKDEVQRLKRMVDDRDLNQTDWSQKLKCLEDENRILRSDHVVQDEKIKYLEEGIKRSNKEVSVIRGELSDSLSDMEMYKNNLEDSLQEVILLRQKAIECVDLFISLTMGLNDQCVYLQSEKQKIHKELIEVSEELSTIWTEVLESEKLSKEYIEGHEYLRNQLVERELDTQRLIKEKIKLESELADAIRENAVLWNEVCAYRVKKLLVSVIDLRGCRFPIEKMRQRCASSIPLTPPSASEDSTDWIAGNPCLPRGPQRYARGTPAPTGRGGVRARVGSAQDDQRGADRDVSGGEQR